MMGARSVRLLDAWCKRCALLSPPSVITSVLRLDGMRHVILNNEACPEGKALHHLRRTNVDKADAWEKELPITPGL
jgi:hypothetical protein